jgi:hypothetical protein
MEGTMTKYPTISDLDKYTTHEIIHFIFYTIKNKSGKHVNKSRDDAFYELVGRYASFTDDEVAHFVNVLPRKPNVKLFDLYNLIIKFNYDIDNPNRYRFVKTHLMDENNRQRELDYWLKGHRNNCLIGNQWIKNLIYNRITENVPNRHDDIMWIGRKLIKKKSKFIGLFLMRNSITEEFLIPALKNVSVIKGWQIRFKPTIEILEQLTPMEVLNVLCFTPTSNYKHRERQSKLTYNIAEMQTIKTMLFPLFDTPYREKIEEQLKRLTHSNYSAGRHNNLSLNSPPWATEI